MPRAFALRPCAEKPATAEQARELGKRLRAALGQLREIQRDVNSAQSASRVEFSYNRAFPVCLCEIIGRYYNWVTKEEWCSVVAICFDSRAREARICHVDCDLALEWMKGLSTEGVGSTPKYVAQKLADAIEDLEGQIRDADEVSNFDVAAAVAEIRRRRDGATGTIVLEQKTAPYWSRSYPHWKERDVTTVELRPDGKLYDCKYSEDDTRGARELIEQTEVSGLYLVRKLRDAL